MGFLAKLKTRSGVGESKQIVVLEGEQLPTDTLKEVIGDAFTVVVAIFSLGKDFASSILTIAGVAAKYAQASEAFRVAFDQFKDLDPTEAEEVTQYVIDKFDIEDDVLEKDIEDVIRIPAKAFAAIDSVKNVYQGLAAVVDDETKDGWEKARGVAKMAVTVVDEVKYVRDFIDESLKEIGDLTGREAA